MSQFEEFLASIPNAEQAMDTQTSESLTDIEVKGDAPSANKPDEEELPFHKHPRFKELTKKNRELEEKLDEVLRKPQSQEKEETIPAEWIALYGDDEKSAQAWKIQKQFLEDNFNRNRDSILNEIDSRSKREAEEFRKESEFIEESLENLDNLTSKDKKPFLQFVEKISPKDADGEVTDYADFGEAWEIYQSIRDKQNTPNNSQKKQLAARSMTRSNESVTQEDAYEPGMGFDGIAQKLGF